MEETKKAVFAQSREVVEDLLMFWEEKDLFVQTATRCSAINKVPVHCSYNQADMSEYVSRTQV